MNRKFISFLSAFCLLCVQISVPVFADNESVQKNYNVYDGYNAVKVVTNGGGNDEGFKFFAQSGVKVEANTDYTAEIWAKGNGCSTLRILNNSNWSALPSNSQITLNGGSNWTKYTLEFNTGDVTSIVFAIANNPFSRGTEYLDCAALYKTGTEDNVLVNPSLEDDGYKWGSWAEPFSLEKSDIEMAPEDHENPPSPKPTEAEPSLTPGNGTDEQNYNVYEGYNSAKIVNDGTQNNSGFKFLSQSNIRVEAGADYTVTFMAKGSSNVTLRILDNSTWSNIDGKEIKTSPNVSDLWTEYSLTFNTGSANNIIVAFVNNTYAKGTVYVDNVTLKKADSDENILPNPGFELQNDQNGYKWGKWEDPFSLEMSGAEMSPDDHDTAPTPEPVEEVEDDYSNPPAGTNGLNLYRGHRSLEIKASASGTGVVYQDVSTVSNKEYVAIFWLKGDPAIKASFEAQNAKTGEALTTNTSTVTASNNWQRVVVEFSSESAVYVSFRINIIASGTGSAYIDDCELFTKYRPQNSKRSNLLASPGFEDQMSGWSTEGNLFGIYTRTQGTLGDAAGGVRIMPVGDSITYGVGDSGSTGGYRPRLYEKYQSSGINTTFVGPSSGKLDGFPEGSGSAGFSGWRIDQISEQIQVWMQAYEPQVILLKIGTNDILQDKDGEDENYLAENAPERFEALVDMIIEQDPEICLYIASIFPLTGNSGNKVNVYNEAVKRIAESKGSNVHYVDMHSVLTDSDLGDHVHPTPSGYDKMASAWFEATKDEIGAMTPAEFVPDSGTAHSGNWSINYNPYHVPYYTLLSYEATVQYINVKKDTDYKVEYYVKGDQNISLQARIQKSSKLTYAWGDQIIAKTVMMGPKWSKVEYTFNSGDTDLVLINFINSCMSTGNGYIDDITICELGTDENLIKDPGVENGGWSDKFPYRPIFDISNVDFNDRVTVTMNGETLTALKTGTAEVSVDLSDTGNVGTLITALYRDGQLIRCAISEPENNAAHSEIEINAEDTADTLKVMLWNSADKLNPLMDAIVIQ